MHSFAFHHPQIRLNFPKKKIYIPYSKMRDLIRIRVTRRETKKDLEEKHACRSLYKQF